MSRPTSEFERSEYYAQTARPIEQATTLNADAYRSPEFYEAESRRVFARSWMCVGYIDQLRKPGDLITTTVGDQPLLVLRDGTGKIQAFHNVCRHRGSLLIESDGCYEAISCPYHRWRYDLTGRLVDTPLFEPQRTGWGASQHGITKADHSLIPVLADTWGPFVFVNLDRKAMPLSVWLGDLPSRFERYDLASLIRVGAEQVVVRANWKLCAENFIEYYHLPYVHPGLNRPNVLFERNIRSQGRGMYTGMLTPAISDDSVAVVEDSGLPLFPRLLAAEKNTAYWILAFPNLALSILPNHVFVMRIYPASVRETIEKAEILVHPSAVERPSGRELADQAFKFWWKRVNDEDIEAVERTQRGLASRAFTGGPMVNHFDQLIQRFENMVAASMVGDHVVPDGPDAHP